MFSKVHIIASFEVFHVMHPLGRVDMLTSPVAAARAASVATGAWVKSKHDMYLIRGSVGA